jgi:hypothetical protein
MALEVSLGRPVWISPIAALNAEASMLKTFNDLLLEEPSIEGIIVSPMAIKVVH